MSSFLTTRQAARALNISQSSVKRWCDLGVIRSHHTAGGHRRIAIEELGRLRRSGHPTYVAAPAADAVAARGATKDHSLFLTSLIDGNEAICRRIAVNMLLESHQVSRICDQLLTGAFQEIGEQWSRGDLEVYHERRGIEIVLRILNELRSLLPSPAENAPRAIGCSPAGDPYRLPTKMVELVLRDNRWDAESLGEDIEFEELTSAIRVHRPKLCWQTCSHVVAADRFTDGCNRLHERFGREVCFVLGGRALTSELRRKLRFEHYCDNMAQLERFAATQWTDCHQLVHSKIDR